MMIRQLVICILVVSTVDAHRRRSSSSESSDPENPSDGTVKTAGNFLLVYSAKEGSGHPVAETFIELETGSNVGRVNQMNADPGCVTTNKTDFCDGNYRHTFVDFWEKVRRVRVEMYKDDGIVVYALFDGIGSDMTNWFTRERLIESSWTDVKGASGTLGINGFYFDFFGVEYPAPSGVTRRLYINDNWGGCPNDVGWMMVVDKAGGVCDFDKNPINPASTMGFPMFLYSPFSISDNPDSGFERADVLQIWVDADL